MTQTTFSILAFVVAASAALGSNNSVTPAGTTSLVYTMTNTVSGNQILVFQRNTDGTLTYLKGVKTGGKGTGSNPGSQGSLLLQGNYLFAVNPGSDTITVLNSSNATVLNTYSSGGTFPVSLAFKHGVLYVLNAKTVNNITGFTVDMTTGVLTPIPGSTQPLSAASTAPAEVSFNEAGTALIVTERNTSLIDVYPMANGVAGPPTTYNSAGITPYGFAVSGHDWFFVSEAEVGIGNNAGSVSSYALSSMNVPTVITEALPLTSTAPCWVAVNAAETYAYVSNNGSNTISQLSISSTGALTLVNSYGTGAGSEPVDLAISPDGLNLYVVNGKSGTLDAFTINSDGGLTKLAGATGPIGAHAGLVIR